MKLPNKIHFAGKNYIVREQRELDGEETMGLTKIEKGLILIEKDCSQEIKEETLIHELMHIAYKHIGDILTEEQQEQIVNAWSRNIYGILKDNNLLK